MEAGLIPCAIYGVGVRFYRAGVLIGYGLALGNDLNACLQQAVQIARSEKRFQQAQASAQEVDISVSVLHHPEPLGNSPLHDVAKKLRRGLDALGLTTSTGTTILLPGALTYNNWSREQFVDAVLRKAAPRTPAVEWTTYQCAEWVNQTRGVWPLRFGFPQRAPVVFDLANTTAAIRLLGSYVYNSLGSDSLPCYYFAPATGERQHAGTSARSLHALHTLDAAGEFLGQPDWCAAAHRGFRYALQFVHEGVVDLPDRSGGQLADCVLLIGLARSNSRLVYSEPARQIANRLLGMMRPDGRISSVPKRLAYPDDQDYLPGAVLLALGEYCRATGFSLPDLTRQLHWYQRRFQTVPNWGMAGWQPQGWRAVYELSGNSEQAELAYAAADWAIAQQLEKNGAFLEDLSPDEPSFDTGFIAEGIAAAWAIARKQNNAVRKAKYQQSWREAMRFMNTLFLYPEDTFGFADGHRAVGGVRCTVSRSDIRIDQVSHCLNALITGARVAS